MNLSIRRAVASDLPQVLRIAEATENLPHWSPMVFEQLFSQKDNPALARVLLVADLEGTVVAFAVLATLSSTGPAESEVEAIAVDAAWRRKGIGRALLDGLLTEAQKHGAGIVRLEVRASNAAALAMYYRAGFCDTGQRTGYYTRPVEDAILLAVQLHAMNMGGDLSVII